MKKLDEYAKEEIDEDEWCDYYYSLADFMWRKGILTDEVRDKAIEMIDSGTGLEIYEESGAKVLRDRKEVLEKFREKLLSPIPPKKKIRPNVYLNDIFTNGDIIAIQLQTHDKPYIKEENNRDISEEEFRSYNGKYVLIQKVATHISWKSRVVPDICDHWAVFRLFEGIYDEVPYNIEVSNLKSAHIGTEALFVCESSMFYFRRLKCAVIANNAESIERFAGMGRDCHDIFMNCIPAYHNPDSELIAAMGKKSVISEFKGNAEQVVGCGISNFPEVFCYDFSKTREENDATYNILKERIQSEIESELAMGGKIYTVSVDNIVCGMVTVCGERISNLYIGFGRKGAGYATELICYAISIIGNGAYADIPKNSEDLICFFKKIGFEQCESDNAEKIRVVYSHV